MRNVVLIFLLLMALVSAWADAQSLAKAELLAEQGLTADAQRELINVVIAGGDPAGKAKALNLLATINIDQNNIRAALDSWKRLIRDYPASPEAKLAQQKLPLLANVVGKVVDETVTEAGARMGLRNADFWASERDTIFHLDSSWIDHLDASIYWYDRVIADFRGTPAARVAYENKMRALIGWKEPGQYGSSYGLANNASYLSNA